MKSTTTRTIRLPRATLELVELAAQQQGLTVSSFAAQVVHDAAIRHVADASQQRRGSATPDAKG